MGRPKNRRDVQRTYSFRGPRRVVPENEIGSNKVETAGLAREGTVNLRNHDHSLVRVIQAEKCWNQPIHVETGDTVIAYLMGQGFARKAFPYCSGTPFLIVLIIWSVLCPLPVVRMVVEMDPKVILVCPLTTLYLGSCVWGFANRFIILKSLRTFDPWYFFSQAFIIGLCLFEGTVERAPIFASIGAFQIIGGFTVVFAFDGFHPAHKPGSRILLVVAFMAMVAITCVVAVGDDSTWASFQKKSYTIHILRKRVLDTDNVDVISRSSLLLLVLAIRMLYRAIMYPDMFVFVRSNIHCKLFTVDELDSECARIRDKSRVSQLPSLKKMYQSEEGYLLSSKRWLLRKKSRKTKS